MLYDRVLLLPFLASQDALLLRSLGSCSGSKKLNGRKVKIPMGTFRDYLNEVMNIFNALRYFNC